jgi:transposase
VTDRAGAIEMVKKNKRNLSRVENSLADGGYSGEPFAEAIKELLGAKVEVVKEALQKTVFFSNFVVRQVCLRARISFDRLAATQTCPPKNSLKNPGFCRASLSVANFTNLPSFPSVGS